MHMYAHIQSCQSLSYKHGDAQIYMNTMRNY